jgi:hypothetical protein
MGISSLLKAMKCVTEEDVHVSRYEGKTVVVDISSWLYKGYVRLRF